MRHVVQCLVQQLLVLALSAAAAGGLHNSYNDAVLHLSGIICRCAAAQLCY
jgi:hypothetical protein